MFFRRKDSNEWCRGVIKEINKEKAEIFFADYGTTDEVDILNIRLQLWLCKKPVQIMRCSLHNVKPVGDGGAQKWNSEHIAAISEEAVGKTFRVTVKGAGSPLIQVQMVYSTSRSRNFNKELVLKGLAEFVNPDHV